MKTIFTYFSLTKMKTLLVLPILYHFHHVSWLTDLAHSIIAMNTAQSIFFFLFILLVFCIFIKNSLLSLFYQKLFSFFKTENKIATFKNILIKLNPFSFFFKLYSFFIFKK